MKRCVVGLVTCRSRAEARRLAHAVLKPKLAACVNLLRGVESHYWWQGKLERSNEYLLLIKTTEEKTAAVTRAIRAAHSYEVPEIIFVPLTRGERRYLKWLRATVTALALVCASGSLCADAIDDAIQQLRTGDAMARADAAERLAQLGGERAANQFREMTASSNAEARQIGVSGLLRVSDAAADLELVRNRLREDTETLVRWSAALALGQSQRQEALPWLEEAARSDRSDIVREMAAEAAATLRGRIAWGGSLPEALKESRASRRLVLAYFSVPESAYCRQFEAGTLSQPEVVARAREFVCVRMDATAHPELTRRYDVRGAPTVLFLDGNGAELGRCAGAVDKERLLARMVQALRGTESFRDLQRRAQANPADVTANWKMAELCLEEGREDLAEPYLRNVIGSDEANRHGRTADALLALGVVLGHQGRHAKAVYCYEQLLARWPAFARKDRVLYCLGLSRLALGRKTEGRLALEQLVRECPQSSMVQPAMETLQKLGAGQ